MHRPRSNQGCAFPSKAAVDNGPDGGRRSQDVQVDEDLEAMGEEATSGRSVLGSGRNRSIGVSTSVPGGRFRSMFRSFEERATVNSSEPWQDRPSASRNSM